MDMPIIIGVDGGGTRSKLAAVQTDGTVAGACDGSGLNYNAIGMEAARNRLKAAVENLLAGIGKSDYAGLALGLSALDAKADEQLVRDFAGSTFSVEKLILDSDVYVALIGARIGEAGVMAISGTGSMVVGLDIEKNVHVIGGWGYKLDEPGGGYGIAIEGLKAAFMCLEGLGPRTALGREALDFFKAKDSRSLIAVLYDKQCEPAHTAQFARVVIFQARHGDAVGRGILEGQMELLARMTGKLLECCPHEVCLYGGIFANSRLACKLYRKSLKTMVPDVKFCKIEFPPELGAVLMFMSEHGMLNDEVVENIKRTWKRKKQ